MECKLHEEGDIRWGRKGGELLFTGVTLAPRKMPALSRCSINTYWLFIPTYMCLTPKSIFRSQAHVGNERLQTHGSKCQLPILLRRFRAPQILPTPNSLILSSCVHSLSKYASPPVSLADTTTQLPNLKLGEYPWFCPLSTPSAALNQSPDPVDSISLFVSILSTSSQFQSGFCSNISTRISKAKVKSYFFKFCSN